MEAQVAIFGYDWSPKGTLKGEVKTYSETDETIVVNVQLEDGRFVEITIPNKTLGQMKKRKEQQEAEVAAGQEDETEEGL